MATALDPTAMDMMAMVSMNDVQLSCVCIDICWGCFHFKSIYIQTQILIDDPNQAMVSCMFAPSLALKWKREAGLGTSAGASTHIHTLNHT